jgi:hypothetical protein
MTFGFGPSEVIPLNVDFPELDIDWMDDDDDSEEGLIL